jgi:hypothetical protein
VQQEGPIQIGPDLRPETLEVRALQRDASRIKEKVDFWTRVRRPGAET